MSVVLKFFYFCVVLNTLYPKAEKNDLKGVAVIFRKNNTSKNFHCLGTFVAWKVILTSCTCVGTFVNGRLVIYSSKQYSVVDMLYHNYVVENGAVHPKCSPTDIDPSIFVHNLGVWRTNKPAPIHMGNLISRSDFPQTPRPCTIPLPIRYDTKVYLSYSTTQFYNISLCLSEYCDRGEKSCSELISMVRDLRLLCVLYVHERLSMLDSPKGSPVICQSRLWGVVSSAKNGKIFWVTLSWDEDFKFIIDVAQKDTNSTVVFKFHMTIIVLAITFWNTFLAN